MKIVKSDYVCVMIDMIPGWRWYMRTYNGHIIMISKCYENKAQCRNVGKKFAQKMGIEWKE